jgi:hypothetical protein
MHRQRSARRFAIPGKNVDDAGGETCLHNQLTKTDNAERMRISAAGNIGISNANPGWMWGRISPSDAIQVGQGNFACVSAISGSIRYSMGSNTLQICVGTGWVSLSSRQHSTAQVIA